MYQLIVGKFPLLTAKMEELIHTTLDRVKSNIVKQNFLPTKWYSKINDLHHMEGLTFTLRNIYGEIQNNLDILAVLQNHRL